MILSNLKKIVKNNELFVLFDFKADTSIYKTCDVLFEIQINASYNIKNNVFVEGGIMVQIDTNKNKL